MIEVKKIAIPFAQSGNKSNIYDTRQPGQAENEATWSTGFPPITMIRKEDGGLPPTGLDFNGIFYDISSNVVFACMGGRYKFDAEYAEKIGGYPKGAILLNDDENKQYISNIANNKIDFNTDDPSKLTAWSVISIADIDKILANKIDNADFSGALKRKRDIDDNEFYGLLSLQADSSIGTGVFLLDEDGKVRGQMVYNNYGLQFAQVQEDGTSQTFTFPRYGNGGEIALTSYVDDKIRDIDTSNLVTKDDITNSLGNSTELVASQALVNSVSKQVAEHGLGYGQEWVDVTDKRAINTTYTNNTEKPILVSIRTGENKDNMFFIDGVVVGQGSIEAGVNIDVVVPPGSSYKSEVKARFWAELR